MSNLQLAELMGVHLATVYRWRRSGKKGLHIEPLQIKIFSALEQCLRVRRSVTSKAAVGLAIVDALAVGGTLNGIRALMGLVAN